MLSAPYELARSALEAAPDAMTVDRRDRERSPARYAGQRERNDSERGGGQDERQLGRHDHLR